MHLKLPRILELNGAIQMFNQIQLKAPTNTTPLLHLPIALQTSREFLVLENPPQRPVEPQRGPDHREMNIVPWQFEPETVMVAHANHLQARALAMSIPYLVFL